MQGYYPQRQIEVFDLLESGLFHQQLQRVLIRMHANRFGQITIARFIVGDQLTEA